MDGCEGGNCLRSHVNKTETESALVMMTKAGVKSNKIMVGVTSYGRSFRMSDPRCSGPHCTFQGERNKSKAYKGKCTATGGYISNAEIFDLATFSSQYPTANASYDKSSDSSVLIYGDDDAMDWVAYMDDDVKSGRIDWIKKLNFAGSSDWAIDLQNWAPTTGNGSDVPDLDNYDTDCTNYDVPDSLQDLVDAMEDIPALCWNRFAVSTMVTELDDALDAYNDAAGGYDDKFGYYVDWVKENINPQLDAFMSFQGKGIQYFTCNFWYGGKTKKGKCPTLKDTFHDTHDVAWTMTYTLDDEDGFFKDLETEYGIEKDWVKFGNIDDDYVCTSAAFEGATSWVWHERQKLRPLVPQEAQLSQKERQGRRAKPQGLGTGSHDQPHSPAQQHALRVHEHDEHDLRRG